jgi:hypothetical protein
VKRVLGICIKKKVVMIAYDLDDPSIRKQLNDVGMRCVSSQRFK